MGGEALRQGGGYGAEILYIYQYLRTTMWRWRRQSGRYFPCGTRSPHSWLLFEVLYCSLSVQSENRSYGFPIRWPIRPDRGRSRSSHPSGSVFTAAPRSRNKRARAGSYSLLFRAARRSIAGMLFAGPEFRRACSSRLNQDLTAAKALVHTQLAAAPPRFTLATSFACTQPLPVGRACSVLWNVDRRTADRAAVTVVWKEQNGNNAQRVLLRRATRRL